MGMAAGRLRHRVSIERLAVDVDYADTDSDGAQVETWSSAFGKLLPAEIEPLSGRDLIAAQAVQSEVTTRIKMRFRAGVVPSMRVNHRGQTVYNIAAVIPDPDSGRTWMTLLCTSGVNAG